MLWLVTMRLLRAPELLETSSQSIEDFSLSCGFNSHVSFRTRFRNCEGLSPRTYRARFIYH
ncbi:helix-turn-helix domain-containing protein, partial [Acinetobacter calcoaceticus]|uniref:helix-turn-helix domain-containing protein n=1 Tax=Acinetobacter calcoaceticus TaxID=471 RepID=UPI003F7C424D